MLFNAHNPAVIAELEHAVHETDITPDHATSSPPIAGKCVEDGPTAW